MRQGIFKKVIRPADLPKVYVGPEFMALPFDTKQSFISVVFAYYFDGNRRSDTVVLRDYYSGKDIGEFNAVWAGLKMK